MSNKTSKQIRVQHALSKIKNSDDKLQILSLTSGITIKQLKSYANEEPIDFKDLIVLNSLLD